ncbi:acyltransferase family protein [Fastidiosibacter lacustris]|uniref:acyltransferase family protein n=1 Tax=Fastidiosibacter lacustris TaxID=2056695 RepID=UPI000E34E170|nr:acyltransferase family protein [Fastidiosibacter lacustris]
MNKSNLNLYRADIDGLRAIAVLLVIFYHLQWSFFSAGFLGVDVFFVISGYLITLHISQSLFLEKFSLKQFYLKRMRRILPALLFLLVVTSFFAWLFLLPDALLGYTKSLLAALLSFSNIYFYNSFNFGYFATDASVISLLHTWSLGVEEQFYIIWPLLLLVCFRVKSSYLMLSVMASIILFLSLFLYITIDSNMAYYMPFTRAFELLFGAILALFSKQIKLVKSILIANVLSLVGIVIILLPAIMLSKSDFPSFWAVVPCVGVVLIIFTGGLQKSYTPYVNKVLALKPLVNVGLISYSLYLWHWPIIAYLNYLSISITPYTGIAVILASILMASLSYFLVEKPLRYKVIFPFGKTFFTFILLPLFLFSIFALVVRINSQFGYNQYYKDVQQLSSTYYGVIKEDDGCHNSGTDVSLPSKNKCLIGDRSKKQIKVLVVGDSHAMAETGMLDVMLKNAGLKAYVATKSSGPFLIGKLKDWNQYFPMKRNNLLLRDIQESKYKYVIIGGSWNDVYLENIQIQDQKNTKPWQGLMYGL